MGVLLWLQGLRNPFLDVVMMASTYLGDQVVVIAVLCWFLWCKDREFAIRLALVFFLGGMVNQLLKLIFLVPRPWELNPAVAPLASALPGATGWSFPSGHVASAVALYGGLLLRSRRVWQRALCVLAVGLVALSRMYAGVHTPLDVGASLGVGVVLLWFAWITLDAAEQTPRLLWAVYAVCGALILAMILIVGWRRAQNQPLDMLMDGAAAAGAAAGFLVGWLLSKGRSFSTTFPLLAQPLVMLGGLVGIVLLKLMEGSALWSALLAYALLAFWASFAYPVCLDTVYKWKKRGNGI